MLASLDSDPQVAAAALAAEDAARQLGARSETLPLLAYSDGSVTADGIEGSATAVIRIGSVGVCATVRLAAEDRALSSGRSEWAGGTCRWSTSLTTARNALRTTGCGKTNVIWRR